jgi:chromosome partitioning protein
MTFAAQPATGQKFEPGQPAASRIAGLQRIMFASQKGGVAKTASAVNVAICLGEQGHKVLVVDTDPIGSVSACFGATVPPNHPGIYGLDQYGLPDLVLPDLAPNVDMLPYAQDGRPVDLPRLESALRQLGPMLAGKYQYVIVDTRPSVSDMARRLCQVVDQVIVVFQCQPLAYRTLGGILGQLQQARKEGAPARLAGLLLTMVDPTDTCQSELERHIRDNLGPAMLPISIPLDRAVGEGLLEDRPIVLYNPDSPVSRAYRDLVAYLAATR